MRFGILVTTILIFGGAIVTGCGGQVDQAGDDQRGKANATGNWNEPRWHIENWNGCDPWNAGCIGIVYDLYPHFQVVAADGTPRPSNWSSHTHWQQFTTWIPAPTNKTESNSQWQYDSSWVELISQNGSRYFIEWQGYPEKEREYGCWVNAGDWCFQAGSSSLPLFDLVDSTVNRSPDHLQRVIHHEATTYKFLGQNPVTWRRSCYYDLTDYSRGTWTFDGCYDG